MVREREQDGGGKYISHNIYHINQNVTSAHWEVEAGRLQVQAQPGQFSNLMSLCLKIKNRLGVYLSAKALFLTPVLGARREQK